MWRDSSHQKLSLLSSPSLWISLKTYDKPLKYSTSFQTPGYAEHCSQSSRCLQDVRRSGGMASQRKGKRWLRKELSCVLIQCGCHSKSEEMRVFFIGSQPALLLHSVHSVWRCSSFQLCYFLLHAGAAWSSELKFVFYKAFFFYLVYLGREKKWFGLKFGRTDILQVCLEVKFATVHWLQLPLWLQQGAECVSEIDAGNKVLTQNGARNVWLLNSYYVLAVKGMDQHEGRHREMNHNYIKILHCSTICTLWTPLRTCKSWQQWGMYTTCIYTKCMLLSVVGVLLVVVMAVFSIQCHRCEATKCLEWKMCFYLYTCNMLTTKEDFFFFSFCIKNIFPSVTLTRNLTGTLAESYFALALTLKYSMNFKLNEMHWEVGGFFFFFHALPSIYYVKEISAKKSWCCSWPQNRQPFNHFMPLVFIRRYLNPRGLDNFAT